MLMTLTLFLALMFAPIQAPLSKGIIEVGEVNTEEISTQNTVILDDGAPF